MISATMTSSTSVMAEDDFRRVYQRSIVATVGAFLTGRTNRLRSLAEVTQSRSVQHRHTAGRRTVAIENIGGSENRTDDFDAEFRPRTWHTQARWSHMLAARLHGVSMPPVELVQVDDSYFVRDGHHRISTAKRLGQQEIEAEVTVWHCNEAATDQPPVFANIWQRLPAPALD